MAGQRKKKGSVRDALVAAQLKNLKPGWYCDGRGLYLNVKPSGSRSWILRTMVAGKRREIGLGSLATICGLRKVFRSGMG